MTKQYWLMKSEPDVFSIHDLAGSPQKTTHWDGVRNYQARNFMKDQMIKEDLILFYHSNAKEETGVAGVAKVAKTAYPDHTSWDKKSKYYDPKSTPDNPRWFMVDVKFVRSFQRIITLNELKTHKILQNMKLLQKGNRLSILPISEKEFNYILKLEALKT